MGFGGLAVLMIVAYVIIFVLSIAVLFLIAQLLIALIRFVKTLTDYWRMRTQEQFHAAKTNWSGNP